MKARLERFWDKVLITTDDCWIWQAALDGHGYGQFWNGSRLMGAHRYIYQQLVGRIPRFMEIDHLCRNSRCVNPSHLEAVLHRVNQMRGKMGILGHWNLAKTHCPHGHLYTRQNTYIYRESNGGFGRMCIICMKKRDKKRTPEGAFY